MATLEGLGTLATWTVVRRPPSGFEGGPFIVAVVDLQAGLRITARIRDLIPEPDLGVAVTIVDYDGAAPIIEMTM